MTTPPDSEAFAAARQICRQHARSFYFASHFLPRERRSAAYAVYAFCRQMDDAVDEAPSIEAARQNLQHLQVTLENIYAFSSSCTRQGGGVGSSVLEFSGSKKPKNRSFSPRTGSESAQWFDEAFAETVVKYNISHQPFLDLLAGCEMDLSITRYATWSDLELYCYRVAGVVGLIMSGVFGLERESARQQAVMMGNAMQLTNILRDVGEDFVTRGRVYLPQEDLDRFGYSIDQLSRGVVNTAFIELMRFQIARARDLFTRASEGLCWLPRDGSRFTATTMAVIYSGILDAIERQNYDVFSRRAKLSLPRKLARLPRCWKLARREPDQPLPLAFVKSR